MVQVDIFWSFALGAGFAASAARQIKKADESGDFRLMENNFFTKTVIYLSCLFAPSGVYLLWAFTGWETMYVWTGQNDLPAWIVVLFAITNVTQGILGFWWASHYIRNNQLFRANLLWIVAYFIMFFILVHGWDGTGYRRFFTRSVVEWQAEKGGLTHAFGLWLALRWLVCPVALTLYGMGVIILPLLFHWMSDWTKRGFELDPAIDRDRANRTTSGQLVSLVCQIIFVQVIGAVIGASILIRFMSWIFGCTLGWVIGLALAFILIYFLLLKPGGLTRRTLSHVFLQEL